MNVLNHLKNPEFLWGLLVGAILVAVIYFVVKLVLYYRKSCNKIVIEDDGGNFVIFRMAFRNFLTGVFEQVPGIELNDVKLKKLESGQVRVDMLLDADADADVIKLRESLRQGVLKEISEKLGISSQIGELNLVIKSLPASDEMKK